MKGKDHSDTAIHPFSLSNPPQHLFSPQEISGKLANLFISFDTWRVYCDVTFCFPPICSGVLLFKSLPNGPDYRRTRQQKPLQSLEMSVVFVTFIIWMGICPKNPEWASVEEKVKTFRVLLWVRAFLTANHIGNFIDFEPLTNCAAAELTT